MAIDIITTEDLIVFKEEILYEIKELLIIHNRLSLEKWIRSSELMTKLNISHGTLQNLRNNGKIPYTKIGGIILYDQEEINQLLEKKKS